MIQFVTFGMFIIDEFDFADEQGKPTGQTIGGGGTYATIGARIWLPPDTLGMIIDRGNDFPQEIEKKLLTYGPDVWHFRDQSDRCTTRGMNSYRGEYRGYEYITPRIRLTPHDLAGTRLSRPASVHFICSPKRALQILSEIQEIEGWNPTTIFEPIPDRCVPEELPSLKEALPNITILSPNAEEALSLLSLPLIVTKPAVENAASEFIKMGVGEGGSVIIRSGALGAYIITSDRKGQWIDAFWSSENIDRVVDVTGAGNTFLGGLAAGLLLENGNVHKATLYASVSASFTVEQLGLPHLTLSSSGEEEWNYDSPRRRLEVLRQRHDKEIENKNH
ncbi:Ribokinase-like protein [Rhizopogon vinicolor AM-OR11-026]|uniref:Ribokinase-like protein n=1 Tax=Rhizopogon vinicolor AM-OR11-026 TaxID=1314800 RepID=A0A1B7N732_9AGAM|nr:Ribokinase-like protein [Rhizopogon vinicolor AM-OR11-026]